MRSWAWAVFVAWLGFVAGDGGNQSVHNVTAQLQALHASIKGKDLVFKQYMSQQKQRLAQEVARVENEVRASAEELEEQNAGLRRLVIQVGSSVPWSPQPDGDAQMMKPGPAANVLVECAKTNKHASRIRADTQQLTHIASAGVTFANALLTNNSLPTSTVDALSMIRNTISEVSTANAHASQIALNGLNATLEHCLQAQQRIARSSDWISTERIPVLEEILSVSNERLVRQDTIDTLQVRHSTLVKGLRFKKARYESLDADMLEHNHVLGKQMSTVSELTKLSRGLPR